MKKFLKYSLSFLFLLVTIFAFAGCSFGSSSSSSSSTKAPSTLKINTFEFNISISKVEYSSHIKELVDDKYVITALCYTVEMSVENRSSTDDRYFSRGDFIFYNDIVLSCNNSEADITIERGKKKTILATYTLNLKEDNKIQTEATAADLSTEIEITEFNNYVRGYAFTVLKCSYKLGKVYEIAASK